MTLRRGLHILQILRTGDEHGLTVGDLARRTQLHRATLHRILTSLIEEGWVERNEPSRYRLAAEAWRLGQAKNAIHEFVRLADPSLDRLQRETGATIFLVKRQGNEGLCVARREGSIPVRIMVMDVGISYPLGVAAGTVAILANLPEHEQSQIISATRSRLTEFPRLNIEIIQRMISETRQRGYSFSQGFIVPGLHSVGVPIFDGNKEAVGSLAAVNLGELLKGETLEHVAALMKQESAQISSRTATGEASGAGDEGSPLRSTGTY